MYNPFVEIKEQDDDDAGLARLASEGDRKALERLVLRHQAWIYNIALRMVSDVHDAEDVTQEILIRMMTGLSTYDPSRGAFRTWLYRMAANHVINMRVTSRERAVSDIMDAWDETFKLQSVPDRRPGASPENRLLIEEARASCLVGMLLCLDRRQRLVFVLGALFGVPDTVGGEVLDISRENFRKILSRARARLGGFFNRNCSLVGAGNPCRCERQIASMERAGLMDMRCPMSSGKDLRDMQDAVRAKLCELEEVDDDFLRLYRSQPFYEGPDLRSWVAAMLESDRFKDFFQLH